jgi:hypothetical protein
MRFTRTANGRLNFDVTDVADYDFARRIAQAILQTFNGRRGKSLADVDGTSWLDVEIMGVTFTVHVQRSLGVSVYAVDEAADGVILDVANYLMANGDKLGIETSRTV